MIYSKTNLVLIQKIVRQVYYHWTSMELILNLGPPHMSLRAGQAVQGHHTPAVRLRHVCAPASGNVLS